MSSFLKFIYKWVLFVFILVVIVVGLVMSFILPSSNNISSVDKKSVMAQVIPDESEEDNDIANISVLSFTDNNHNFYLSTTGTISANQQTPVLPATAGQIKEVKVENGDFVKKGDVLVVLSGMNGSTHQLVKQYDIAKTNYSTANKAYSNTLASTEASLKTAELQVENARNLTKSLNIDSQGMAMNVEDIRDSKGLVWDSLSETKKKNLNSIKGIQENINDIEDSILDIDLKLTDVNKQFDKALIDAQNGSTQTVTISCCGVERPIDINLNSSSASVTIEQERSSTIVQLETQKTQLDSQLKNLYNQKNALQSASVLSENQVRGQLNQLEDKEHSLLQTHESFVTKLGLSDNTSMSLKMAEQGLNTAKTQVELARTQAKAQKDLAKINFDLISEQKDLLTIKAPFDGIVENLSAVSGGVAGPQSPLLILTNDKDFILKVFVSAIDAQNIHNGDQSKIRIGDKWLNYPIKSVSSIANPVTKLVEVDIELPPMKFIANQVLDVKIQSNQNFTANNNISIPLDAVIIGSSESYVYAVKDGVAVKKVVVLGDINGDFVYVDSGLSVDDLVVVNGAKKIKNGQKINIINE